LRREWDLSHEEAYYKENNRRDFYGQSHLATL
jgi:hypothetical protein